LSKRFVNNACQIFVDAKQKVLLTEILQAKREKNFSVHRRGYICIKGEGNLVPVKVMKAYRRVEIQVHRLFTLGG